MRFVRGDVYELKAPRQARGHEQHGSRLAVVVQSDDLPLSTWLIAPTSTVCRSASFRPVIDIDGVETRVVVEQTTAVDPETRLGAFVGRVTHAELQEINRALMTVLELP